ncbi:chromosomal replication initiator protein DnaA [Lentisphaerota bacterium ZTH]|nr:chromosomal replication initiator protein DnaA [Lentisphaerota bacterium]WET07674.1 chromosomal replication initiator protein DnaA [Lentisphaerota bacterium ZTH]
MRKEETKAEIIWNEAASRLQRQLHKTTYEQWFQNILPVNLDGNVIVLGVSDDFFADWLKDNFDDVLSDALASIDDIDYAYKFEYGHTPEKNTRGKTALKEISASPERSESKVKLPSKRPSNCLSRHTFENFVVGEENRYAYTAAKTAAENAGLYNPLYIYGGTGIGKTHLLQAVAHESLIKDPSIRIKYTTCEEFLNNYVDSLRLKKHAEFRSSVRNVDILLVDDVHMLANKTQLQEEFFNTFNTLYNQNKQIILTSDKQPCEIAGLEDRLVSRFESGVTTEINAPGFETRLAILKMMQEEHLVKLEDDVLQFIAANISSSVRRLKGALLRLVAFASAMSVSAISVEKAETLLHKLLEEENASKTISLEAIQRAVAEHFDIRVNDILSSKRPKNIAEPRMVAMFLCRKLTAFSFPEIGTAFGKNHATVMNACKKVPELCSKNENMRRSVSLLERQLHN